MFRGKRTDGNGWVTGWLHLSYNLRKLNNRFVYVIQQKEKEHGRNVLSEHEVIPSTISTKTFQKDKNSEDIYGSFMLDGYGMTEGGDRVILKVIKKDKTSYMLTYLVKQDGCRYIVECEQDTTTMDLRDIGGLLEIIKQENK